MAVSVKDFLDAIRGRYQDEPNKVEVTGSNESVVFNQSGSTITVTAGSTVSIGNITANKAKKIMVNIRTEPWNDSELEILLLGSNTDFTGINPISNFTLGPDIWEYKNSNLIRQSKPLNIPKVNTFLLRITNKATSERKYRQVYVTLIN